MLKLCFDNEFFEISIDKLAYGKPLPENIKKSFKYKQILSSIREIGLIEPVIIYPVDNGKIMKVIDGHLRTEALKDLNINKAFCIISSIDDSYTPNKHVNRITVIEEHRMIKKAINSNVPIEKLSSALGISIDTIKARYNMTKGISPETTSLLSDKNTPISTLDVIRKMKPLRQAEVANIMINFDNFSAKFALSLLHTTEEKHLIKKQTTRKHLASKENLIRLEKEMVSMQVETDDIKGKYAENVLQLVIIKNHITKLLNNPKILLWLLEKFPDYLNILKRVSDLKTLNEK